MPSILRSLAYWFAHDSVIATRLSMPRERVRPRPLKLVVKGFHRQPRQQDLSLSVRGFRVFDPHRFIGRVNLLFPHWREFLVDA